MPDGSGDFNGRVRFGHSIDSPSLAVVKRPLPPMDPISDPLISRRLCIACEQLPPECFTAYCRIEDGLLSHQRRIKLGVGRDFPEDLISRTYFAVTNDNPLTFFAGIHVKYEISDDVYVSPQYRYSYTDSQSKYRAMLAMADRVAGEAGRDPVRNVELVNDYILDHVNYMNFEEENNQFMDSALIEGYSVCSGISKAASFLLNYIGVPCGVLRGKLHGVPHSWNVVSLGGCRYHLDVTNNRGPDGKPSRRFFLLNDGDLKGTHSWEWNTVCDDLDSPFSCKVR